MINGGNGREISEQPLKDLIDRHVDTGWRKTHFLSFSESKKTAQRFGLYCNLDQVDSRMCEYKPYYGSDKDWDFAFIRLDTDKIELNEVEKGVYHGIYTSTEINYPKCRVVLINVSDFLENYEGYETSKQNSARDEEWLILPATPIELNTGIEFSSILYGGCIEIIKYKKIQGRKRRFPVLI